jgi:hypothetical protein
VRVRACVRAVSEAPRTVCGRLCARCIYRVRSRYAGAFAVGPTV